VTNVSIPPEVRTAALNDYLNHPKWSMRHIALKHGVGEGTVRRWVERAGFRRQIHEDDEPTSPHIGDEPSAQEIGRLVFRSIAATLRAIEARAIATSDPQWIAGQNAADLAQLEHAQREYVLRAIASLRPVDEFADVGALRQADRDGALDSPT
jgi:hypothetical protein